MHFNDPAHEQKPLGHKLAEARIRTWKRLLLVRLAVGVAASAASASAASAASAFSGGESRPAARLRMPCSSASADAAVPKMGVSKVGSSGGLPGELVQSALLLPPPTPPLPPALPAAGLSCGGDRLPAREVDVDAGRAGRPAASRAEVSDCDGRTAVGSAASNVSARSDLLRPAGRECRG